MRTPAKPAETPVVDLCAGYRSRPFAAFSARSDRMIPEDEGVPLQGATFADFDDQAEALAQTALPVVLAERAA